MCLRHTRWRVLRWPCCSASNQSHTVEPSIPIITQRWASRRGPGDASTHGRGMQQWKYLLTNRSFLKCILRWLRNVLRTNRQLTRFTQRSDVTKSFWNCSGKEKHFPQFTPRVVGSAETRLASDVCSFLSRWSYEANVANGCLCMNVLSFSTAFKCRNLFRLPKRLSFC